ncbi:MAG: PIN domain-containing protein [Chloroflexaceae bacterium]|jgi:predicted nucleic acid-binding protein|nr:PIN domain-containing protein [Chloroflexaceae bacterium]
MFTLDTNIFVRELNPNNPDYPACNALLDRLNVNLVPVACPSILVPEIAGVISRESNDSMRGRIYADLVANLPYLTLVPCDDTLVQLATELAADYRLRGMDALYLATAIQTGMALVTLDQELRTRAAPVVRALTPAEALAEL